MTDPKSIFAAKSVETGGSLAQGYIDPLVDRLAPTNEPGRTANSSVAKTPGAAEQHTVPAEVDALVPQASSPPVDSFASSQLDNGVRPASTYSSPISRNPQVSTTSLGLPTSGLGPLCNRPRVAYSLNSNPRLQTGNALSRQPLISLLANRHQKGLNYRRLANTRSPLSTLPVHPSTASSRRHHCFSLAGTKIALIYHRGSSRAPRPLPGC